MIWKSATDVGCAVVQNEEYYVCCQYFQIGNVEDEAVLTENVLRPRRD